MPEARGKQAAGLPELEMPEARWSRRLGFLIWKCLRRVGEPGFSPPSPWLASKRLRRCAHVFMHAYLYADKDVLEFFICFFPGRISD